MTNRILRMTFQQKRLSVAEAELWIYVRVERIDAATELRGRLNGPKCLGVETVQIAYPVRYLPRIGDTLQARVLIPEPNLWTVEMPFRYEGIIELWQDGQLCDSSAIATGFKMG